MWQCIYLLSHTHTAVAKSGQDLVCVSASFTQNLSIHHLPASLCGGVAVFISALERKCCETFSLFLLTPLPLFIHSLAHTTTAARSLHLSLDCCAEEKGPTLNRWFTNNTQQILHAMPLSCDHMIKGLKIIVDPSHPTDASLSSVRLNNQLSVSRIVDTQKHPKHSKLIRKLEDKGRGLRGIIFVRVVY